MLKLEFDTFEVILENESDYVLGSSDNTFDYDMVYQDEKSSIYRSSNHGIKVYRGNELYKSAIVCAVGGGTGVFEKSAVIDNEAILICCANKIFSLQLPDLTLNWYSKVDPATCFGIYKADNGLFTHGEIQICRLDNKGNILWENGLRDIIVNIDSHEECFILHDTFIELMDFNSNKYKLDFNGRFLDEVLSKTQKDFDLIDKERNKKYWWKIWN